MPSPSRSKTGANFVSGEPKERPAIEKVRGPSVSAASSEKSRTFSLYWTPMRLKVKTPNCFWTLNHLMLEACAVVVAAPADGRVAAEKERQLRRGAELQSGRDVDALRESRVRQRRDGLRQKRVDELGLLRREGRRAIPD